MTVEAMLYEQPIEKLVEACQYFKIRVEDGLSKSRLLRKIRTEIDKKVDEDEDDLKQFLLELEKFCGRKPEQSEEEPGSNPDYYKEMVRARKEVEEMTTKFAQLMELQHKKLQEAEEKYNEALKGKRVSSPETGMNLDGKNIIRIKDFKISGSISSEKNRLPFSSLSKQIESALQRGYPEADIIDGVINAVSPSLHLRIYLESIKSLTLKELRKILRSHYGEKSSSESYQELACAVQENSESPLTFLMRALKLRQQVLMSSQEPGTKMQYDGQLVQNVFLHTIETGLSDETIRLRLRPFLHDQNLSDDNLIKELNLAVAAENERANKMSTRKKAPKPAQINANCVNSAKTTPKEKTSESQDKILANLNALKADLDSLKEKVSQKDQQNNNPRSKIRKSACQNCISKGTEKDCDHCFFCGSSEHCARGCRKRNRQGNRHQLHQGEKCSWVLIPKCMQVLF